MRLRVGGSVGTLWLLLSTPGVNAAGEIQAIGAEKCAGSAKTHEVQFLAPESASVEATAKVLRNGVAVLSSEAVTLSVNGTPCKDGRCAFQAKKGETYRLSASTAVPKANDLCIAVTRP